RFIFDMICSFSLGFISSALVCSALLLGRKYKQYNSAGPLIMDKDCVSRNLILSDFLPINYMRQQPLALHLINKKRSSLLTAPFKGCFNVPALKLHRQAGIKPARQAKEHLGIISIVILIEGVKLAII